MNSETSILKSASITVHSTLRIGNRFFKWVLGIYLVIAPINWLPGISLTNYNILKTNVFILLVLILLKDQVKKPTSFISIKGFIIILLSAVFAFFNAVDASAMYSAIKDITIPFLLIIIIYNYRGSGLELLNIFKWVVMISIFISLLIVFSNLTGSFDLMSPDPWDNLFSNSGLGGYRTGWSNSLFLVVPFILYYSKRVYGRYITLWSTIGVFVIMAAQFISGGRAGLLASFSSIILFATSDIRLLILYAVLMYFAFDYLQSDYVYKQLRLEKNKSIVSYNEQDVDETSSYRMGGYIVGLELFKSKPVLGYGFGQADVLTDKFGYHSDIHNVWLKRMVEGGVLFVGSLIFFFLHFSKQIVKINKSTPSNVSFYKALVIPALLISFLEPNYMIGSVQGEAFFWVMVGFLLRNEN